MTRRRLLGTFAWFVLLLIAGAGRLVRFILQLAAWNPRVFFTLAGLSVALSITNPFVAFQLDGVLLPEHVILSWGATALGAVILANGLRSPWVRHLRGQLRRRCGFRKF